MTMSKAEESGRPLADLSEIGLLIDAGSSLRAVPLLERILESQPFHPEALHFLGVILMEAGNVSRGEELLRRACLAAPDDPHIAMSFAATCESVGNLTEAATNLERAASATPPFPPAILQLGLLREKLGQSLEALRCYVVAIATAQKNGRWLSPASTPVHLHDRLGHAMRYIQGFAERHYQEILASLQQRYGRSELKRVERSIAIHLKKIDDSSKDPRQIPKFFYFPQLPAHTYFPAALCPWIDALEASAEEILVELERVLAEGSGLENFLRLTDDASVDHYVRGGQKGLSAWVAFFFYRHGKRYVENNERCPVTAAAIDKLPLVRINHTSPEALFSILAAGAEITPHRGVTNSRTVVHLPLIVPQGCRLYVGGEEHEWRRGRAVVFDDTYEHGAWNRSDRDRVVLIADVWNPYLTEIERAALSELIPEIARVEANLSTTG